MVPLGCNLYGHPLLGLCGNELWVRSWRKIGKSQKLGVLVLPSQSIAVLVYVDDCKMVGRKESLANQRKHTDLEDPTPLLNQVYVHCTERLACNDESVITTMNVLFWRIITPHVGDGGIPSVEAMRSAFTVISPSSLSAGELLRLPGL